MASEEAEAAHQEATRADGAVRGVAVVVGAKDVEGAGDVVRETGRRCGEIVQEERYPGGSTRTTLCHATRV